MGLAEEHRADGLSRSSRPDGRESERSAALESIGRGVGVLVVGQPGSGLTHFVKAVLAEVGESERERIWRGDDVHHLDADQVQRLAQAIESGKVLPLATCATHVVLPRALDRLCRDGALTRIDLPPVTVTGMLGAVEDILDAPLDIASIPAFVPQRSGGDLVVLREAVRQAREAGALIRADGVWRLDSDPPPSDRLRRFVLNRMTSSHDVDSARLLMLDILALAPGLRLNNAQLIADTDGVDGALERLEADGAVEAFAGEGGLVLRLRDPAAELVLPRTVGLLRRERLRARIVEVLARADTEALSGGELVALAKHAWDLGHRIDATTLTRAAIAALKASRAELALQLAQRAVTEGGGFDTLMVRAAAESQLGDSVQSLDTLLSIEYQLGEDPDRRASWESLIDIVRERAADPMFGYNLPSRASFDDRAPTSSEVVPLVSAARTQSSSSEAAPARLDAVLEGERLIQEATLAVGSGRMSRGRELVDEAERLLREADADVFPATMRRIYNGLMDRAIGESIRACRALRDATVAEGLATHAARAQWALGQLLLYSGRCVEAVTELRAAMRMAEQIGMDRTMMFMRAELAIALAQTGDVDSAREILGPALSAPADGFGGPFLAVHAQGWIHAAEGRPEQAIASFLAAAEQHEARGHSTLAVYAYYDVARAGGVSEAIPRIDVLEEGFDCPTMEFLIDYVRVLAETESPQVDTGRLAREFDSLGNRSAELDLHLAAAEAFAHADRLHTALGRTRDATSSARRRAEQLAICGTRSSPFVFETDLALTTTLSDRETEIATRAAAGESNREIAEALVLSIRTVETHLQRVYRKLGVRGRSELAEALPAGPAGSRSQ